jgi:hypothetical protein
MSEEPRPHALGTEESPRCPGPLELVDPYNRRCARLALIQLLNLAEVRNPPLYSRHLRHPDDVIKTTIRGLAYLLLGNYFECEENS